MSGPGILTEVLDEVLETLGAEAEAMAKARAAFDERRGPVFQDEDGWESRTRMFLEWYAVERPDGLTGRSPVAVAAAHEPDPRRRAAFDAWRRSYRCLAEIVRLGDGRVEILDLLGGARIAVDERRGLPGVELGDIAELRILAFEDQIRFGGAFLWHPAGIRGALVARIEALTAEGKSREEILDIASSLAVRSGRYKHVPAAKVYGD